MVMLVASSCLRYVYACSSREPCRGDPARGAVPMAVAGRYTFVSPAPRPSEPPCLRRLSPDNTVFVLCQLVPPLKLSSGLQSEPLPELSSGPPLAPSLDLLYEPPSELEGAPCS